MTQATPPVRQTAYGTPGGHQPGPLPQPSGGPTHRGRGRGFLVGVIVGVVALVGAGVAGFMTARAGTGGVGPTECGGPQCIPSLSGQAVMATLEERGFVCEFTCDLTVGSTSYHVSVAVQEDFDLISSYQLSLSYDPQLEPSPRAMGLLTWFATLPFGEDAQEEATTARQWLTDNVGNDESASIRGFEYRLTAPESGQVRFTVSATPDRGNPFDPVPDE